MKKNSKKLGISALVLIAAMLTVGIYFIIEGVKKENKKRVQYNIEQHLKDLEKVQENENSNYNYYDNLREKCKTKDSYNCCLASVDKIEELNVKASGEGRCETGFKKNTLLCIDSYSWCEKAKIPKNKENDNAITVSNEIVSVSELINSKVPEGIYVEVNGIAGQCIELKVSSDYEGLPSGCRIHDKNNKAKAIAISTGTLPTLMNGEEISIGGRTVYCGGKKRDEYICYLEDVKILNDDNESKEIKNKKNNPFKKKNEDIICTQEVKKCSDGSFVGRNNGNDCKFDKCK